jgi:hypothetical protein
MQPTGPYIINSSNHQVRSQTIALGAFHNLWFLLSRYNPRLQLLRHNGPRPRIYNHVACRRTGTSPHDHNAVDDFARSLTGVGLTRTETLPPMVHRHCPDLPSPRRAPTKARTSMAHTQVARSHHTESWAQRTRSRRGCSGLCGFTESKD